MLIVALTVGERWTRDQLAALRDSRFSPPAVAAFLIASQRRANQTRAARPELTRQAWSWIGAGTVAWLFLAVTPGPGRGRVSPGLAWWLLCGLMLDWHLGMVETVDVTPAGSAPPARSRCCARGSAPWPGTVPPLARA